MISEIQAPLTLESAPRKFGSASDVLVVSPLFAIKKV
jgi:hypothetical protein